MNANDFAEFTELLDDTCRILSRGAYTPNARNAALWFSDLREHSLDDVRAAFEAHRRDPDRGRFVPVPGDILGKLADRGTRDGRPGSEEAWSIAIAGRDERLSVVLTDEIATAWGAAIPILGVGDEVGARMAFREVYTREVAQARTVGKPLRWRLSEGHDAAGRARAITEAANQGRIVPDDDLTVLPPPRAEVLLPAPADDSSVASAVIGHLRLLSAKLAAPDPHVEGPGAAVIRETRERQRATAAEVAAATGQPLPADTALVAAQARAKLAEAAETWGREELEARQLEQDRCAAARPDAANNVGPGAHAQQGTP
jgi:hypothetical protein